MFFPGPGVDGRRNSAFSHVFQRYQADGVQQNCLNCIIARKNRVIAGSYGNHHPPPKLDFPTESKLSGNKQSKKSIAMMFWGGGVDGIHLVV